MLLILAVIYIVFISLGLPDSLFGVAWPVLHKEFGINESFASVYSIIITVCTGGISFVAGTLIRKFGTSKVTFISILLTAIGLIGISFSPNIIIMILFAIIMGYGAGAIDTGLNNFVSLHYKAQHMNWLHCFWGVGVTVSPLIMSAFLGDGEDQWRDGYRIIALLQLIIATIVLFSLKSWRKIEKNQQEFSNKQSNSEVKLFDLLKLKGVITSILSLAAYCSMEFLLGTWGATYAVNVFSLNPEEAAKWVSLYYGGIMVGRMISGFISMKVSDNNMIRSGTIAAFIGILILALPIGKTALVGLLLIGAGFGPIFPSVLHNIPERFGAKFSADLTGYHMGGAYAIGFTTQMVFGFIATATTFVITPFVLTGLCICLYILNEITLKKLIK